MSIIKKIKAWLPFWESAPEREYKCSTYGDRVRRGVCTKCNGTLMKLEWNDGKKCKACALEYRKYIRAWHAKKKLGKEARGIELIKHNK